MGGRKKEAGGEESTVNTGLADPQEGFGEYLQSYQWWPRVSCASLSSEGNVHREEDWGVGVQH